MHGLEKDDVDAPEGNANLGVAVSANPLSFAPMLGRSFGNGVQYCGETKQVSTWYDFITRGYGSENVVDYINNAHLRECIFESLVCKVPSMAPGSKRAFMCVVGRHRPGGHFIG